MGCSGCNSRSPLADAPASLRDNFDEHVYLIERISEPVYDGKRLQTSKPFGAMVLAPTSEWDRVWVTGGDLAGPWLLTPETPLLIPQRKTCYLRPASYMSRTEPVEDSGEFSNAAPGYIDIITVSELPPGYQPFRAPKRHPFVAVELSNDGEDQDVATYVVQGRKSVSLYFIGPLDGTIDVRVVGLIGRGAASSDETKQVPTIQAYAEFPLYPSNHSLAGPTVGDPDSYLQLLPEEPRALHLDAGIDSFDAIRVYCNSSGFVIDPENPETTTPTLRIAAEMRDRA